MTTIAHGHAYFRPSTAAFSHLLLAAMVPCAGTGMISNAWRYGCLQMKPFSSTVSCSDLQTMLRIPNCETFQSSVNRPNLLYEASSPPHVFIMSKVWCEGRKGVVLTPQCYYPNFILAKSWSGCCRSAQVSIYIAQPNASTCRQNIRSLEVLAPEA